MDIYLIRHTRTDTVAGLCYGQTDVPLANSFKREVRRIADKLPELSDECVIISSPLSRCLDLAQQFNGNLISDTRLLEIDFGDWEGKRFDDIDKLQLKHWTDNFVSVAPPNGESFQDLCQRVAEFWQELLASKPADQIVLITHAGVIRAVLVQVLKISPENAFNICVDIGSVHKLQCRHDYTYIHYLNG